MPDCVRIAMTFLDRFYAGDIAEATQTFAPNLRAQVSDDSLARTREQLVRQYGKPLRHSGTRTAKTMGGEADIIYLFWDFEKQRVDARLIVTPQNQIVSLSFETPVIR